jgi:predicted MFS family arabinose efflux permease
MAQQKKIKLAILFISLVTALSYSASVILSKLQEAFPQVNAARIQSFVSNQELTILVFTLLGGLLTALFTKKKLVAAGLTLIAVFGVMPMALQDYDLILHTRLGFGAGLGLISPLSLALISEYFTGEERASLSGTQFACFNIGQAVISIGAGLLVETGWKNVCLLCLLAFAALIAVMWLLPKEEPRQILRKKDSANYSVRSAQRGQLKCNIPVLIIALLTFCYNTPYLSVYSFLSLMVTEESIGSSSIVGYGLACMSIAGMITGLLFGKIFGKLSNVTGSIALAVVSIGFFFLSNAKGPQDVYLAMFIMGTGNAVVMSFLHYQLILFSPPGAVAFCTALSNILNSIGAFLVPHGFGLYLSCLNKTSYRAVFFLTACIMISLTVTLLLYAVLQRKILRKESAKWLKSVSADNIKNSR